MIITTGSCALSCDFRISLVHSSSWEGVRLGLFGTKAFFYEFIARISDGLDLYGTAIRPLPILQIFFKYGWDIMIKIYVVVAPILKTRSVM